MRWVHGKKKRKSIVVVVNVIKRMFTILYSVMRRRQRTSNRNDVKNSKTFWHILQTDTVIDCSNFIGKIANRNDKTKN